MEISLQKLREIGFSEYESKIYYCLLQKEYLTTKELSQVTNIPRTKIYPVLDKLEKQSFCSRVPGSKKTYRALNPNDAITKKISSLKGRIEQLEDIGNNLAEHYQKYREKNNLIEYVEIIKDKELIEERGKQLEKNTKTAIRVLNKSPYLIETDTAGFEANIRYSFIFDETVMSDQSLVHGLEFFEKKGVEIRLCHKVPLKIALFDEDVLLVYLKDQVSTRESYTALFIHHRDMVSAFLELFDIYYNKSVSLSDRLKDL